MILFSLIAIRLSQKFAQLPIEGASTAETSCIGLFFHAANELIVTIDSCLIHLGKAKR
jgi:hypothetical protein